MESYEKSFINVCRLCLRYDESHKYTSLVDSDRDNGLSVYGETVKKLTSLDIDFNDKLPKNICFDCKNELRRFECFKSMCRTNCERLNSLVNQHKNSYDEGNMEAALQYSMFTEYFLDRYPEFQSKMVFEDIPLRQIKEENSESDIMQREIHPEFIQSFSGDIVVPKVEKIEIEIDYFDTNNMSDHESQNAPIEDESQSKTKAVEILPTLKNNLVTQSEHVDWTCNVCNKKLSNRDSLRVHMQSHNNTLNLTCKVCNKKLSNKSSFKMHMQTHKKANICDQCGKGFTTKCYMNKHQIAHHGVPSSFECDTCSFRATSHLKLIEHIRLHTGERPFMCEKCNMTFRRDYLYKRHLKLHGEKSIQCPKCLMKFYILSDMKNHFNNVHERTSLYLCHLCNTSYATTQSVRKHLVSEHDIARESQGKIMRVTKNTHAALFKESKS